MKKLILIHGWGGSGQGGWFDWLRQELENRGWKVTSPDMPDTDNPKINAWVSKLQEVVGDVNENTFLVGGVLVVKRYLDT